MSSPNDALTALLAALPTHPDVSVVITRAIVQVAVVGRAPVSYEIQADGSMLLLGTAVTPDSVVASWPVPVPPPVALPAPLGFTAVGGNTLVTLTWQPVPGATAHRLEAYDGLAGGTRFGFFDVAADATTGHFDAVNGQQGFYAVRGLSGPPEARVEGTRTAILMAVAQAPAPPPVVVPSAPTNLVATPSSGSVFLTWAASIGATSYNVKRKSGTGALAVIGTPTASTYTDSTAVNGTAYTYVVSATNTAGTSGDSASTSATPVAPPVAAKVQIGTQFWHAGWMPSTNTFKAGAIFDGVSNPFHPQLIEDLKKYTGPLRAMDFLAQVQTMVSSWAGRTKLTDGLSVQTSDQGIAPELFAVLCNATGRDAWVTIPARTQVGRQANDYALQWATSLFKNLDPSLRVLVEYANETWNGGPGGGPGSNIAGYCITQAKALGLPGSSGDGYEGGFRFHAVAAYQCHKQFEGVFGAGSSRLIKVLAGQRGNAWLCDVHKEQYLAEGGSISSANTAYALAPYFGSGSTTLSAMSQDLDSMLANDMAPVVTRIAANGFMPICYEGGVERFASGAPALSADPAMGPLYTRLLDWLVGKGFKIICLYLHLSPNTGNEAWGALKTHGGWTTPKSIALLAAIAQYR